MSSRAHTSALLAYLRADPALADIVFDGFVPGQAPSRYVIVFADRPEHETTRLAGRRHANEVRHTVHSVGSIPAEAQWLADRVEARLTPAPSAGPSVRLTVGGVLQGKIRHDTGDPLRTDPPVYFLADDYVWESTP